MALFDIFRRNQWPPDRQSPPWGSAPSIHDHIAAHIEPDRPVGLSDAGYELPDDHPPIEGALTYAPGALDGILGHHAGSKSEDQLSADTYEALKAATTDASAQNLAALYRVIKDNNALGVVDPVLERMVKDNEINPARLGEIAEWFVTKAADREPVKFMMAMLGAISGRDDSNLFLTLGRHDEFTLYSAAAIAMQSPYPETEIFKLAKSAEGWGRINTVERLAGATQPEIKEWLLREGYKNNVMYEYLACICARAGELHSALAAEVIGDGLFDAAFDLIEALLSGEGGPAEGLSDYEHGCAAIGRFLYHGQKRFGTAGHYWLLFKLKERLDAHLSGANKMDQDWTAAKTKAIVATLDAELSDAKWPSVISRALAEGERQEFWSASRVSASLGIDPWPNFYQRTEAGEDYWWDLMRGADDTRIDQVLELAEKRIPLDLIGTGPAKSMGMGSEFAAHGALDFILQELDKFPGKGWKFVKTGLQSPVIRNRNMAIRALTGWGRENWPQGAISLIEGAISVEPDPSVKDRLTALLGTSTPRNS